MQTVWSLQHLLGQQELVGRLQADINNNHLAHAYLFTGAWGTGRLSLARGLVADLFCLSKVNQFYACGSCRSCKLLQNNSHPDYIELSRDNTEIRIASMIEKKNSTSSEQEDILSFLQLKPVEWTKRVVVIPDAERMRLETANAFLKTLEEPPGNALILLTANMHNRLPETINSRCRRFNLKHLPQKIIAQELVKKQQISLEMAKSLAQASDGSLGLAFLLATEPVYSFWQWLSTQAFMQVELQTTEQLAKKWLEQLALNSDNQSKRQQAILIFDLTAALFRTYLRTGKFTTSKLLQALELLWQGGEKIFHNVKPETVVYSTGLELISLLKNIN